jgi:hypothetical protein
MTYFPSARPSRWMDARSGVPKKESNVVTLYLHANPSCILFREDLPHSPEVQKKFLKSLGLDWPVRIRPTLRSENEI